MARALRQSKQLALARVDAALKGIAFGAIAGRRNQMDAVVNVLADTFFGLWHDCRRAKDDLNALGDVTLLDDYAREQYGEAPAWKLSDVVTQALADLQAVQDEVGRLLQVDANGWVQRNYARCRDEPPYFNFATPAVYATTATLIDALIDGITIEVL